MIIYKTTNLVNGKIYIGQDSKNNSKYLGSGKRIKKAFAKYGKENFRKDILEYCNNKDELDKREVYWIKFYNSTQFGYNISEGGQGNNKRNYNITEEHKNNISKGLLNSKKRKLMWINGHAEKLKKARNNSIKVKNLLKSTEFKTTISKAVKQSEKFQAAIKSAERTKKIKEGLKNSDYFKKCSKKVILLNKNYDEVEIFNSISQASKKTNIPRVTISTSCKLGKIIFNKYYFKYYE